jgi:LuxR family transcriptional regulator, maltose regulon positive regulatory protein
MLKVQNAGNIPLAMKTTPPNLRKVIGRERLFDLLNAPPKSPLVWVSGPAGFGKTTLVKTYLDTHGRPFLWYKIDSRDADWSAFLHFFGGMIRSHFRNIEGVVPSILDTEPPFNLRTFSETIISSITGPLTFVFDDYQDLPFESPLSAVIPVFLEQIPPGVRFIFISREEPPAFMARFQARHGMKRVGGPELRLTLPEATKIARLRGHRLRKTIVGEILECSNGWAAGFALLLEGRRKEALGCRNEVRPRIIFDYFAELLEKVRPECRELLLSTSFLPILTTEIAAELKKDKLLSCSLDQLCSDNLFTEKIPGSEQRYAYHPLFQEFLQQRASELLTPDELRSLWRRCGMLNARKDPRAAATLLRLAEDWEGLEKLVHEFGTSLVGTGRMEGLSRMISDIPERMKEHFPRLLYWSAMAMMNNTPGEARREFERAFRLFESAGHVEGSMLSWCGIVESIAFSKGDHSELNDLIARMESLLADGAVFPSPATQAQVTCAMTIAQVLSSCDHRGFKLWSGETMAMDSGPDLLTVQAHALRQLVLHSFWKGRIGEGVHYLSLLQQKAGQPDSPPVVKLHCLLGEMAHGMFTGSYDQCLKVMSEGVHLADESGVQGFNTLFLGFAAMSALDAGESEEAEHLASAIRKRLKGDDLVCAGLLAIIEARVLLFRGYPDEAVKILDAFSHRVNHGGLSPLRACMHLVSAMTFLSMENSAKAMDQLLKARQIAVSIESEHLLFHTDMCAAQMALDRAEHDKCRSLLKQALQRARTQGLQYHLVDHPAPTTRLLAFALKEGIEAEYVRLIVTKRKLVPDESSVTVEDWPWLYRIRTFGWFSIEREGSMVTFQGKAPQKPLAMLKLLICHGGRAVPEHVLSETLWPDAEGDQARSAFSTTLNRLRKILGDDKVLKFSERQLSLNPRMCWVDLWSLEREFEEVRQHVLDLSSARVHLSRIIDLYRGPFLSVEKNEQDYAPTRERLSRRFESAVLRLVNALENAGGHEEAVEAYEYALEREVTIESFYEGLMRCYAALDMMRKAIQVFDRCQIVLSRSLGMTPSVRMTNLKNTLKKEMYRGSCG